MKFEIIRDESGAPRVNIFDGFAEESRPYDPETDGWMKLQLKYSNFPAIQTGEQMKSLVDEVNALRRENWQLKKSNEQWIRAAGFKP